MESQSHICPVIAFLCLTCYEKFCPRCYMTHSIEHNQILILNHSLIQKEIGNLLNGGNSLGSRLQSKEPKVEPSQESEEEKTMVNVKPSQESEEKKITVNVEPSQESEEEKIMVNVKPSQESEEKKITVNVELSQKKEEAIQAFDQAIMIKPNYSQSISAEVLKAIKDQREKNYSLNELVLDQIKFPKFTPEIVKDIEKFKGLEFLSLKDCGLTTLEGFPKLPNLIRCEVTDNKIPGTSLTHITGLTELQSLSLGGNPINSIEDLKTLTSLSKIVELDLFGCPVSEQADYREKVFGLFPGLQILDNKDVDGEEVEYDEEDSEGDETDLKEEQKLIDNLREKIQKYQNELTKAMEERSRMRNKIVRLQQILLRERQERQEREEREERESERLAVRARAAYSNRSLGTCWGCGGGPGHTWSIFCRGNY